MKFCFQADLRCRSLVALSILYVYEFIGFWGHRLVEFVVWRAIPGDFSGTFSPVRGTIWGLSAVQSGKGMT